MATAAKLSPHRRRRKILPRRHATLRVTTKFSVTTVNVDGISTSDVVRIRCGGVIIWNSPRGKLFRITAIKKKSGPGPSQPFKKDFPNSDPPNDKVYSDTAKDNKGETRYKYTVLFKQGPTIDPDVVIQQ